MSDLLLVETEGHICTVSLNRPEKRNALNPDLLRLMKDTFSSVQPGGEIRVVVLRGVGEKAFLEEINKKILMFKNFYNIKEVILTGRRKNFKFDFEFKSFDKGFESAKGAALIADGISGGESEWILKMLELKNVTERVFSYILPPRNSPSFFPSKD